LAIDAKVLSSSIGLVNRITLQIYEMKTSISKWSKVWVVGFAALVGSIPAVALVADDAAESKPEVVQQDDDALTKAEEEEAAKFKKITKAQWKKKLSKTQYAVTREHDTEPPFNNKYHDSKKDGVYVCVCCGLPLFDSKNKFDSGTGWPSFYQPLKEKNIGTSEDDKLGYARVEVHCHRCDAHLGHVFKDAPQTPTGLRYCMNSASLNFLDRAAAKKLEDKKATAQAPAPTESK
jgi:peptide-methionine (R)-S-oxide reductase